MISQKRARENVRAFCLSCRCQKPSPVGEGGPLAVVEELDSDKRLIRQPMAATFPGRGRLVFLGVGWVICVLIIFK